MTAAVRPRTIRVSLVDLSGEQTVRYAPLSSMCLSAALEADPHLAGRAEIAVLPFLAGTPIAAMAESITASAPDVLGLSCQGWNVNAYRQLLPTLRQLLPGALIVLGGNHVSHQGDRWLTHLPEADIVVNGEGEQAICEIARWWLGGAPELPEISGITYRRDGVNVTTDARARIASMDAVPSPYLAGSVNLHDVDVALWETNRGCPYHCSFCYWGGAVGQKLSRAEFDRLRDEIFAIGAAGVSTVFLCDANFGILPRDVEIARLVVETHRRYGVPHTLHVNWAKNHAGRVGEILDVLCEGGVHTNVYLALQTLSRPALKLAGRDERGRPEMMSLARRILDNGGEVGAELIFGLPGETLKDFRAAYDDLLPRFPSLLLHPLWILPNTTYDTERETFGLVTLRPDPLVDYEGVLYHHTLSVDDNRAGLRLLMADEILIETQYARTTVRAMVRWAGLGATEILDAFADFVATRPDPLGTRLQAAFAELDAECYFHRRLRGAVRSALFADRTVAHQLLDEFVSTCVSDPAIRHACRELARHDTVLLPRPDLDGDGNCDDVLPVDFDTHAVATALLSGASTIEVPDRSTPVSLHVRHPRGFARHSADAIDFAGRWRGQVTGVTPSRT